MENKAGRRKIFPYDQTPLTGDHVVRVPVNQENGRGGETEFRVQVVWEETPELSPPFPDMESVRPAGTNPLRVREEGERIWLWCPRYIIFLDLAGRAAEARITHPMDWQNALRLIYFFCSLESDSLLLHAAGVMRRDRGYIFPGVSGAGKTTIVRNSPGMTVLTDEVASVQLRQNGGGVMAHGTPFSGDWHGAGAKISVLMQGLYFPSHSSENRVTALSPGEVLTRLLPCVCTYSTRRDRLNKVFDLAVKLSERVRGFHLGFCPTPDFWQIIDGS